MPKRTVFNDEDGNELDCYINKFNRLFISCGKPEDELYNGYITLSKEEVNNLIDTLLELHREMAD